MKSFPVASTFHCQAYHLETVALTGNVSGSIDTIAYGMSTNNMLSDISPS